MQNITFLLVIIVALTDMFNTERGKHSRSTDSLCCLGHVCQSVHPEHSAAAQQPTLPVTGQGLAGAALLPPLFLSQAALPPPVPLECESASAMLRRLMEKW